MLIKPPRVVHRRGGCDISIMRPGKWGNPYSHLDMSYAKFKVKDRTESLLCFQQYAENNQSLLADLHELDGKILGCVCKPLPCHGDILILLWFEHRLRARSSSVISARPST